MPRHQDSDQVPVAVLEDRHMSKEAIPLTVADITPFARSLAHQLKESSKQPSHLSLLNMLAKASGFRNYQHLRASQVAKARLDQVPIAADFKRVEKALQQFDAKGWLIQWPAKRSVQELCLWVMWAQLPSRKVLEEWEVNGLLNLAHRFDDAAILRRSLIGMKLVTRKLDGSDYLRVEQMPPPDAVALIREVEMRKTKKGNGPDRAIPFLQFQRPPGG